MIEVGSLVIIVDHPEDGYHLVIAYDPVADVWQLDTYHRYFEDSEIKAI